MHLQRNGDSVAICVLGVATLCLIAIGFGWPLGDLGYKWVDIGSRGGGIRLRVQAEGCEDLRNSARRRGRLRSMDFIWNPGFSIRNTNLRSDEHWKPNFSNADDGRGTFG
jgi:hypothetical protein